MDQSIDIETEEAGCKNRKRGSGIRSLCCVTDKAPPLQKLSTINDDKRRFFCDKILCLFFTLSEMIKRRTVTVLFEFLRTSLLSN